MSKILIVIGSARVGRVADKVLDYIKKDIKKRDGITTEIADLATLDLPFYYDEQPPMSPTYIQTDKHVAAWSNLVKNADSVLFITPEYNRSLTAMQKNAIDWLFLEWSNKPVTAVAYGWSGGAQAVGTLCDVLTNVRADVRQNMAQLSFAKDLNPNGSLLNENSTMVKIAKTIDEVLGL